MVYYRFIFQGRQFTMDSHLTKAATEYKDYRETIIREILLAITEWQSQDTGDMPQTIISQIETVWNKYTTMFLYDPADITVILSCPQTIIAKRAKQAFALLNICAQHNPSKEEHTAAKKWGRRFATFFTDKKAVKYEPAAAKNHGSLYEAQAEIEARMVIVVELDMKLIHKQQMIYIIRHMGFPVTKAAMKDAQMSEDEYGFGCNPHYTPPDTTDSKFGELPHKCLIRHIAEGKSLESWITTLIPDFPKTLTTTSD